MKRFFEWIYQEWIDPSFGLSLMKEGNPQGYVNFIFTTITLVFGVLLAYRFLYLLLGIFGKSRVYESKPDDKRYAFVLSARNEEKVLGNLIDSIRDQDYNQKKVDIIVVADNCTDKTAEIAIAKGCRVYERHDLSKCRKGYALQFLFEKLKSDLPNGIETYYAYIFMDSDNVMAKNFLRELNNAFQAGYDICTGYRNVKNADDNWITALSAINWYRSIIVSLRARSIINSAAQIGGTGYGVRSFVIKDGWDYTMITEDGEMTTRLMANEPKGQVTLRKETYDRLSLGRKSQRVVLLDESGRPLGRVKVKVGSQESLEMPDKCLKKKNLSFAKDEFGDAIVRGPFRLINLQNGESVTLDIDAKIRHYLRLGYVEAAQFFDEQPTTFRLTIRQRLRWAKGGMVNWFKNDWKLFWSNLKRPRWSKYDIYWEMFPYGLFTFLMGFAQLAITTALWASGASGNAVDGWANIWSYVLNITLFQYLGGFVTGIVVIVKEWKKVHFTVLKALAYVFLWPLYDMAGTPISIMCLFMRITWKPIPHHVVKSGEELMEIHRQKEATAEKKKKIL